MGGSSDVPGRRWLLELSIGLNLTTAPYQCWQYSPRSTQAESSLAICLHGDPVVMLEAMGTGEILVASDDRSYSTRIAIIQLS